MQSTVAQNIYVDGRAYLKGALGLSWFPSAEAQRNKSNYEADLNWMLRFLYAKFTSSQVILQIAFHRNKNVVIRPRPIPAPSADEDDFSRVYNADTIPSSAKDAVRAGQAAPAPGKDPIEDPTKGTGAGSDALVEFNPGVYKDAMGAAPGDRESGLFWARMGRSDCVLLHELVHAMSCVSGVDAGTMAGPEHYDNLEEFTAVVISNVYAAETGGVTPPNLAGGHGNQVLPLLLRDSRAFYNRYRRYIQDACDNHPALAQQLKKATGISHNPFIYCDV